MSVDTDQIEAMLELGAPTNVVADRLGCSARHVRRIRSERDVAHDELWCWDTEWERHFVWGALADIGMSNARIAFNVGRSVQAVSQWRQEDCKRRIERTSADPAAWGSGEVDRSTHSQ